MPIGIDTDQTVDVVLRTDDGKPAESRPVFRVRFLTPRQERRARALLDEADAVVADEARIAKVVDAIRVSLAGWSGLRDEDGREVPYSTESVGVLADLLHYLELADLAWQGMNATRLKVRDLFLSGSPSASPSAESATAGDAANAERGQSQ